MSILQSVKPCVRCRCDYLKYLDYMHTECTSKKFPKLLVLNCVDTASAASSSLSLPFELRSIGSAPFCLHIEATFLGRVAYA